METSIPSRTWSPKHNEIKGDFHLLFLSLQPNSPGSHIAPELSNCHLEQGMLWLHHPDPSSGLKHSLHQLPVLAAEGSQVHPPSLGIALY